MRKSLPYLKAERDVPNEGDVRHRQGVCTTTLAFTGERPCAGIGGVLEIMPGLSSTRSSGVTESPLEFCPNLCEGLLSGDCFLLSRQVALVATLGFVLPSPFDVGILIEAGNQRLGQTCSNRTGQLENLGFYLFDGHVTNSE